MPSEQALRIADTILAVFWAAVLVRSLASGFIFGRTAGPADKASRRGQYWFMVFIFALMVLHFGGLAYVGQRLN